MYFALIRCLFTSISFYLFANPNSRLSLSISLSLSLSILRISTYIFFLSIVSPPLFLYISLSIQIDAYLFQSHILYPNLVLIYPPVSMFISFLSNTISFYLFFIKIYIYLSQFHSPNLSLSLVY